ncbi:MAG: hypothetical protein IPM22_10880 [Betaproteobacteria bacterium]|nr:hypothetical protein [Betaproteobacteria bacterium]
MHREDIDTHFDAITRSGNAHVTPIAICCYRCCPGATATTRMRGGRSTPTCARWRRRAGARQSTRCRHLAGADVAALRLPGDGAWIAPWHPIARGHVLPGNDLAGQPGARPP